MIRDYGGVSTSMPWDVHQLPTVPTIPRPWLAHDDGDGDGDGDGDSDHDDGDGDGDGDHDDSDGDTDRNCTS